MITLPPLFRARPELHHPEQGLPGPAAAGRLHPGVAAVQLRAGLPQGLQPVTRSLRVPGGWGDTDHVS